MICVGRLFLSNWKSRPRGSGRGRAPEASRAPRLCAAATAWLVSRPQQLRRDWQRPLSCPGTGGAVHRLPPRGGRWPRPRSRRTGRRPPTPGTSAGKDGGGGAAGEARCPWRCRELLLLQRAGKALPALVGPRAVGRRLGLAPPPAPSLPRGCPGALVPSEGTAGLCGGCCPPPPGRFTGSSPPQPRGKPSRCRRAAQVWAELRVLGSGETAEKSTRGLGHHPPVLLSGRRHPPRPCPRRSPLRGAGCAPGDAAPSPPQGCSRFSLVAAQAVEALLSPFGPNSEVTQCDLSGAVWMLRSQQCRGWLVWVLLEAIPSEFCPGTVLLTARVLPRGPSAVIPLFTSTHLGDSWFLVGSIFF